jgi:hypothetical protein
MRRDVALASLVVVTAAALAFTVPRYGVPHVRQGFNPGALPVVAGSTIVQTLRVTAGGLNEVSLRVLSSTGDAVLQASVSLWDGRQFVLLRQAAAPAAGSTGTATFRFAPIHAHGAFDYAFAVRVDAPDPATRVTFQTTEGHEYRDGGLSVDGQALPADLVMRTDAAFAQPWRAFARGVGRRTGMAGLEWAIAVAYLITTCALLRYFGPAHDQPAAPHATR